jgi:hypothetical protein
MRLSVSDPELIPALVESLRANDCVAEPMGSDQVAVLFPWLRGPHDARQALLELRFFARAWEALNPGVEIRVG